MFNDSTHSARGQSASAGFAPRDAWIFSRLIVGHDVDGILDAVSGPYKRLARHLAGLDGYQRPAAWDVFLASRDEADVEAIIRSVASADPDGDPPADSDRPWRPANLGDIRALMTGTMWAWEGWIPSARLCGIAAFEGVGKSRLALDLTRRVFLGLEWPDGQAPMFPRGTRSVWACSDGNQDELAAAAEEMDLPDDAINFAASADDPLGGSSIDDAESLATLDSVIAHANPGLVFVDTFTNATNRDVCRQNELRMATRPLVDIAQRRRVPIILLLHLVVRIQK